MTPAPIFRSARTARGLVPYNLPRPATSLPSQRLAVCTIAMSVEPLRRHVLACTPSNCRHANFEQGQRLEAENAALRHQLNVLRRKVRGRVQLTNSDRLFLIQLYRWFPSVLQAITIIRPETLVRWHRAGFRRYWRWKSRSLGGRPKVDADLRALIRRMR